MAKIYATAQDGTDAKLSITLYNWTGNLIANGWNKFPNGLMIQWGIADLGGNKIEGESAYFTFPTQFLYSVFVLSITTLNLDTSNPDAYDCTIQARYTNVDTFNVYKQRWSESSDYWFAKFNWVALGH